MTQRIHAAAPVCATKEFLRIPRGAISKRFCPRNRHIQNHAVTVAPDRNAIVDLRTICTLCRHTDGDRNSRSKSHSYAYAVRAPTHKRICFSNCARCGRKNTLVDICAVTSHFTENIDTILFLLRKQKKNGEKPLDREINVQFSWFSYSFGSASAMYTTVTKIHLVICLESIRN